MERQTSIAFEGIDSDTPLNEKLSAKYTKSFAYYTMNNRLPYILTKVINNLVTNREQILQDHHKEPEDLKSVIGKISKLKNELVTNKPFIKFNSNGEDVAEWNNSLQSLKLETDLHCWYYAPWLYAENYLYRRLWEIFENSSTLQNLDPFACQKEAVLYKSFCDIKSIAKNLSLFPKDSLQHNLQSRFTLLLKLSLWSNRCDLSLTDQMNNESDSLSKLNDYNPFILCDDSLRVYEYLHQNSPAVIDFVTDNSSYEIFCDFCLCDFLCASSLVSKVIFHVKKFPWYVSDTTRNDIKLLLEALDKENIDELCLRWRKYFEDGTWCVLDENYWTLPYDFNYMKSNDKELYESLETSHLVIFKGDLNYRKLLSDINWDPCEKFENVLGDFKPTSLLSLRTVKSDLICGLLPNKSEEMVKKDKSWMRTGEYATIQFYCR